VFKAEFEVLMFSEEKIFLLSKYVIDRWSNCEKVRVWKGRFV
jgi:hypothetical protein